MSLVASTAPVAPIGWPWATAPPSTLTMSSGNPSSRATTIAITAKASLISIRSTERISQPVRCRACLTAGTGPRPNMPGSSSDAVGDKPGVSGNAVLLGPCRISQHHRRRGVVQSRGIAGGDGAVWTKCGFKPRQRLERRVGPIVLVLVELRRTLFARYLHRHDLCLEMPGGLRAGEGLLRAQRPTVLSVAGHLIFFDQVFGMPARMRIGKRVVQAVAQHAVVKLSVAHAIAPAGARNEIRRKIHVLHAAGDRDTDIA